jgi:hypothetical protein
MPDLVAPPTTQPTFPIPSNNPPLSRWSKFSPKNWSRRTRLIAGLSLGSVLLIAGGTVGLFYFATHNNSEVVQASPKATPTPTPTPIPKDTPNPLNGVLSTATDAALYAQRRPMAVMVENHVQSRPQSGLQEAEVMHEGMAEGGITRFMAVYLQNQPDRIGPVRSARKHFVEWAAEYDATYAHWGGSAEAQDMLRRGTRPRNLDQFNFAAAFFRDYSLGRSLEHTGYTSMELLRKVNQKQGWEAPATMTPWSFKSEAVSASRPQAQTVSLAFLGTAGYDAAFTYRSSTNDYVRATGGKPHVDAAGVQLTTTSIVLLYQNVQGYQLSGQAAVRVTTIGSGKAVVIQDGVATEGLWAKSDINSRTRMTDVTGKEIALNRGKVWVVSVPVGSSVSY